MSCEEIPLLEFLEGSLEVDSTEKVAAHLQTCPVCRERFQVMVGLKAIYADGFQESESSSVTEELRPGSTEARVPGQPPARARWRLPWALAASLLLAALIPLLYLYWGDGGKRPEDLATRQPYPFFPLQTRSQADLEIRRKAFEAYGKGQYREAEAYFSELPPEAESLFLHGLCLYLTGRFPEAVRQLEKAEAEPRWEEPARWYRANALLASGRVAQAESILVELSTRQGDYQKRAEQLLKDLGALR